MIAGGVSIAFLLLERTMDSDYYGAGVGVTGSLVSGKVVEGEVVVLIIVEALFVG